jgi:DNA-binding Lrp family transcriptional regulator
MKEIELKLISELLKNSRRSDRELAKAIGTSQPTVSRMISRLEKEGVVKEYTVIPDFQKLAYSLAALTFGRVRDEFRSPEMLDETRRKFIKSFNEKAFEVILDERGMGMEYDGVIVSLHRSYSEYANFKRWIKQMPFIEATRLDSFLIDLNDKVHYRYLTFSYLAKHILHDLKKPEQRRAKFHTNRTFQQRTQPCVNKLSETNTIFEGTGTP